MLISSLTLVFEIFSQNNDPKSINFLTLTKYCRYPISKVLISNLTFIFENLEFHNFFDQDKLFSIMVLST